MRIGSLFSGIGGLELGLERAIPGAEVAWQVEQDPYARAVLAKHWPQATRYEDVRQVGAHNLEPVDLLCGGFPCQDISQAGKQAGIDGERSGLWAEYARIIGELRPRYVVVENVPALLARGMGRVLGDLAACGYDAIWDCIPAQAVGAHHRRDRVFIIAWAVTDAHGRPIWNGAEREEGRRLDLQGRRISESIDDGPIRGVADTQRQRPQGHGTQCRLGEGSQEGEASRGSQYRWPLTRPMWAAEPNVGRVADGVLRRVDRLRCLGNAVVPQVAEVVGRMVLLLEEQA
jgi:DNA (cytosine-5)-methyltransferase 1